MICEANLFRYKIVSEMWEVSWSDHCFCSFCSSNSYVCQEDGGFHLTAKYFRHGRESSFNDSMGHGSWKLYKTKMDHQPSLHEWCSNNGTLHLVVVLKWMLMFLIDNGAPVVLANSIGFLSKAGWDFGNIIVLDMVLFSLMPSHTIKQLSKKARMTCNTSNCPSN